MEHKRIKQFLKIINKVSKVSYLQSFINIIGLTRLLDSLVKIQQIFTLKVDLSFFLERGITWITFITIKRPERVK